VIAPGRPGPLVQRLLGWPVRSQHGACRNALVASTALTQQRIEREEVERFLLDAARRHDVRRRRAASHPSELPPAHREVI
jgi:hypothetical protein